MVAVIHLHRQPIKVATRTIQTLATPELLPPIMVADPMPRMAILRTRMATLMDTMAIPTVITVTPMALA